MRYQLLIRGGTCVTPHGAVKADVGVVDGKISEIGALDAKDAAEVFDATHLHVLPGAIDSQVHFREPGLTHKEDLSTGSAAAALGGVTTFFEMPNTQPNTDNPERLAWKVERAKATSWVDFAFYLGATKENATKLGQWEQAEGCAGVKCFLGSSTGTLLVDDPKVLEQVLRSGNRPVACHSEDEARLKERKALALGAPPSMHPEWRDEETAVKSTQALLQLARQTRRRVHVLHVTTRGEIPLLASYRDVATFEVTPQHLTFAAPGCYAELGTLAQMNPPIRSEEHRAALWEAIQNGAVDVIGSDHAPHTLQEKAKVYPESPSGMPGVQTLLPVMLTHVAEGRLTLERLVQLIGSGPARVFGMQGKGRIELGSDADFAIVDLAARKTITREWIASRCKWSPFEGFVAKGWPKATIVRGRLLMRDDQLLGKPSGLPVKFT